MDAELTYTFDGGILGVELPASGHGHGSTLDKAVDALVAVETCIVAGVFVSCRLMVLKH